MNVKEQRGGASRRGDRDTPRGVPPYLSEGALSHDRNVTIYQLVFFLFRFQGSGSGLFFERRNRNHVLPPLLGAAKARLGASSSRLRQWVESEPCGPSAESWILELWWTLG